MSPLRSALAATLVLTASLIACGGTPEYDVVVTFNETVVQDDIGRVLEVLLSYDAEADIALQESFPPVARGTLATDVPDFCRVADAEIEPRSYVAAFDCDSR